MKQSHSSRLKSPRVRQCRMVLPIIHLPGSLQPAWGQIHSADACLLLGRDCFAAVVVPADSRAHSFAGGWFKALSLSGRGSYYSGNGGSNYSIIPPGGD